jgi:alcohol dehydrogenase class IV
MRFEFATAGRVVFGAGCSRDLAAVARELGRHALVVTGKSSDRAADLLAQLAGGGIAVTTTAVPGEPDVPLVDRGTTLAREAGCDLVIGIGGGSAIDAAKAIAALAANDGGPLDYLEVVGRGQPLTRPSLPCIAVPTTAGTGSEVTRNAVLGASDQRVKVSMRHASMLPRVALVDPDLTVPLPSSLTATTGLDALAQLIEPYVSSRANPMTDAICVEGIRLACEALPAAVRDGSNRRARASMALASLWSGMALANAGLGAVHGFAGPIGGRFGAPHGAICAALLPHVMAANVRALEARPSESDSRPKFDCIARLLTNRPAASAVDGVDWVRATVASFGIPPLAHYGVRREDVSDLVAQASRASSMKGNPIALTSDELGEILAAALSE